MNYITGDVFNINVIMFFFPTSIISTHASTGKPKPDLEKEKGICLNTKRSA